MDCMNAANMNAINAKIKVKRSRLLKRSDYMALCRGQGRYFASGGLSEGLGEQLSEGLGEGLSKGLGGGLSERFENAIDGELGRLRSFIVDGTLRRILMLQLEPDYLKVWDYIKTLPPGQNKSALTHIKGTEIDLQNLLRLYRLKRYYSGASAYPHLIPVCYKITKNAIKQMAEASNLSDFIALIEHTPYKHLGDNFELAVGRAMSDVYTKTAKRYPRSMAGVMGYFFAKNAQLRNLEAIAEGIKHHLSPDEIHDRLLLARE